MVETKKKELSVKSMATLSEKLYQVRRDIEEIEEHFRESINYQKTIRDGLQGKLLDAMNHHGLRSLKTISGDSFYIGSRKSINIINPIFALKWAKENHCFNVDKRLVAQKLKSMDKVPAGFELIEGQYIGIKKPKEKVLDHLA